MDKNIKKLIKKLGKSNLSFEEVQKQIREALGIKDSKIKKL